MNIRSLTAVHSTRGCTVLHTSGCGRNGPPKLLYIMMYRNRRPNFTELNKLIIVRVRVSDMEQLASRKSIHMLHVLYSSNNAAVS